MAADKQSPQGPKEYSGIYDPDRDFDSIYTRFTAKRIAPWLTPEECILELGSATLAHDVPAELGEIDL